MRWFFYLKGKVGIEVALRYVKEVVAEFTLVVVAEFTLVVVAEFTLQISRASSTTTKKGGELKWQ